MAAMRWSAVASAMAPRTRSSMVRFVTGQGVVDGAMLGREEHAERRNRFVEACDTRWRVNPRSTQNGAA